MSYLKCEKPAFVGLVTPPNGPNWQDVAEVLLVMLVTLLLLAGISILAPNWTRF